MLRRRTMFVPFRNFSQGRTLGHTRSCSSGWRYSLGLLALGTVPSRSPPLFSPEPRRHARHARVACGGLLLSFLPLLPATGRRLGETRDFVSRKGPRRAEGAISGMGFLFKTRTQQVAWRGQDMGQQYSSTHVWFGCLGYSAPFCSSSFSAWKKGDLSRDRNQNERPQGWC